MMALHPNVRTALEQLKGRKWDTSLPGERRANDMTCGRAGRGPIPSTYPSTNPALYWAKS
jgi:hypothetical protein